MNQLGTQHPRFLPQPGDGVDFAIVTEQRERLNTLKGRFGIGAVARMANRDRRHEFGIAQVRVILVQRISMATHFIDDAVCAARRDMNRQFAFELHLKFKQARVRITDIAARRKTSHLPENWLLGAGQRAEHFRTDFTGLADQNLQHAQFSHGLDLLDHIRRCALRNSQVHHEEMRVFGQFAGLIDRLQRTCPQCARNVSQQPAAIAFTGYFAGAVPHAAQCVERARNIAVAGAPLFTDVGNQGTGVMFFKPGTLKLLRRDRTIHRMWSPVWRVAQPTKQDGIVREINS